VAYQAVAVMRAASCVPARHRPTSFAPLYTRETAHRCRWGPSKHATEDRGNHRLAAAAPGQRTIAPIHHQPFYSGVCAQVALPPDINPRADKRSLMAVCAKLGLWLPAW